MKKKSSASNKWRDTVGQKRLHNHVFEGRDDVVLWDIFPVEDGEILKIVFESKRSEWEQGIRLMCDKGMVVNGNFSKGIRLWYSHSLDEVLVTCQTENGLLGSRPQTRRNVLSGMARSSFIYLSNGLELSSAR